MNPTQFEQSVDRSLRLLLPDISADTTLGVALSGGADSVALTLALKRLGYSVLALHCNFHLRGAESNDDALFCRQLCRSYNIPLVETDFDTVALALPDESIEMTCRRLRYDYFAAQYSRLQLHAIAIAHHYDDNIETVLLNLFRGTGLKGLCGIPSRRDIFVRPMLDLTRNDILSYLADIDQPFRTDSTNLGTDFRRNSIRNSILPTITSHIPKATNGVAKTSNHVAKALSLLAELTLFAAQKHYFPGRGLHLEGLINSTDYPQELLYHTLTALFPPGAHESVVADIVAASHTSGRRFRLSDGSTLILSRGYLSRLCPTSDAEITVSDLTDPSQWEPLHVKISILTPEEFHRAPKDASTLYLDEAILSEAHTFRLRRRANGDRIAPFGMKGTKLVSDLMADARFDENQKNNLWVLTCDDRLLWAVGLRASRLFTVTPETRKVIAIRLL